MVFGTSFPEIVQTEFWLFIACSPTIVASIFISIFLLITIGASRATATSSENQFRGRRSTLWKSRFIFIAYRQKISLNIISQYSQNITIIMPLLSPIIELLLFQSIRESLRNSIWRLWSPIYGTKVIHIKLIIGKGQP